jgi:hypothetical protein
MKRTFKIYSKAKATILINTFSCTNEILKYIEQFMFFWIVFFFLTIVSPFLFWGVLESTVKLCFEKFFDFDFF